MHTKARFCVNCGVPQANEQSKFCHNCGTSLEIVMDHKVENSPTSPRFELLTPNQIKTLHYFESVLEDFVKTFDISSEEFEDFDNPEVDPNCLYSTVPYYATGSVEIDGEHYDYGTDGILIAGYVEEAINVYLGKKAFKKPYENFAFPSTSIIFICSKCDGDAGSSGVDCENCSNEGDITFDATWDENGVSFW